MRDAFAQEITQLAQEDERVVLLSGDIGNRLFDGLRKNSPERFFNCGVAEQNMMSVAAGMGLCGLRPVVYTIAPFTTLRCLEQIKLGVAYHHSPVTIIGTGSGLSYAKLGPTHQSMEDFSILRAIPNMQVLAPWDSKSLRMCLRMSIKSEKPTYIRIGKKGEPDLTGQYKAPDIGEGLELYTGKELCILAVGTIADEAVTVIKELRRSAVYAGLVLIHTVKPTPERLLYDLTNRYEYFVTLEEHAKVGGFGESFTAYLAMRQISKQTLILGSEDKYMSVVGTRPYARSFFKINATSILQAIKSRFDLG